MLDERIKKKNEFLAVGASLDLAPEVTYFPFSDKFCSWPASIKFHHCWAGGLLDHTYEVWKIAQGILRSLDLFNDFNLKVILLAALYHDYGKVYDYDVVHDADGTIISAGKNSHYARTHHIIKSYEVFRQVAGGYLDPKIADEVSHCILAHHGKLEWGSPVTPQTPLAWCLHLADMASVNVKEDSYNRRK